MTTPKSFHPHVAGVATTKNEITVSQSTKEKAESIKAYIEGKYNKMSQEEKEKKEAWEKLRAKMAKANLSLAEQELIKKEILHREAVINREGRAKISIRDFLPIAIIGKGAFGEVRLVRNKKTGEVLAMKKMKKSEMITKHQINHVKAEKDVLAKAHNDWIVELKYSFQDERHLYLAMEYLPGGDLMTLLIKKEILSEEESRFYIAEIILAVESVHTMNYIHRDLKPDNVLLDRRGHVKLSDFGLCKYAQIKGPSHAGEGPKRREEMGPLNFGKMHETDKRKLFNSQRRQLAYSTVGTPDYIAPEVFGQNGYSETVDWWSVGVILFEMLVGYPPFFSDDPSITCQKIIHWKKTLMIPSDANLTPAATDLVKRLICDSDHRLGTKGVQEIKSHPFFEGMSWDKVRSTTSPFIPDLTSEIDTTNFDKFEEDKADPFYPEYGSKAGKRIDAYFPGYTFKKEVEIEKSSLYQKVANGLSVITEASKLTTTIPDENETGPIPNPKENNPPLSTKHSTQSTRLLPKDNPLSPVATAHQNMGFMKNPTTASSKARIQVQPKPQVVAVGKPTTKAFYGYNIGLVKNEPLRVKMLPGGDRGPVIDLRESTKRTTTPTRKFK